MVFVQALDKGMLSLTILGIVTSLIGAYYYFKVIIAMFLQEPAGDAVQCRFNIRISAYCPSCCTDVCIGNFPGFRSFG
jgi:NADH:ubiquinone oxidoreductase subunit 2 (subunit N)